MRPPKYTTLVTATDIKAINLIKDHYGDDLISLYILTSSSFHYTVALMNREKRYVKVHVDMGEDKVIELPNVCASTDQPRSECGCNHCKGD